VFEILFETNLIKDINYDLMRLLSRISS